MLMQKTHEEVHRSNKNSESESHTASGPRQPGELQGCFHR